MKVTVNDGKAHSVDSSERAFTTAAVGAFKQAYLDATEADVAVTMSPAGLPGRVIRNAFLRAVEDGTHAPDKCFANCLGYCSYQSEGKPFCIASALVNAQRGEVDDGLVFCGANVYRSSEIVHASDLINELFPNGHAG